MVKIISLFFIFGITQCKSIEEGHNNFSESYTGYDQIGEPKGCYKEEQLCTKSNQEMIEFSRECLAQGFEVFICNCDESLCSGNIQIKKKD